jgi:hypothetical protein
MDCAILAIRSRRECGDWNAKVLRRTYDTFGVSVTLTSIFVGVEDANVPILRPNSNLIRIPEDLSDEFVVMLFVILLWIGYDFYFAGVVYGQR